jgi:hypothetical protein
LRYSCAELSRPRRSEDIQRILCWPIVHISTSDRRGNGSGRATGAAPSQLRVVDGPLGAHERALRAEDQRLGMHAEHGKAALRGEEGGPLPQSGDLF